MTALYERYRPACWEEVIGQSKAVASLKRIAQRDGFGGQAFFLTGKSGQGKTTLAKLIALSHADEMSIEEIDAQWCTPARLKELGEGLCIRGWGEKAGRAIIVNEAHGLSDAAIRQLLTMLEPIPPHVVWIFTTTKKAAKELFSDCLDAFPLLSRCKPITLNDQGIAKLFAERCREIAQRENLDGRPIKAYLDLADKCQSNMRAMLQAIEAGEMAATIES